MNTLYYGDNLKILRDRNYFPDECVDLIYLDPPFNSNRNYNVLFKDESGKEADAQITAFEDTWHWTPQTELAYHELITTGAIEVSQMIEAMRRFIGTNQIMAYLVMMAARLVELHRVLKPTGSMFLHCDPTASHYLKIVLDIIFGKKRYRNEMVWCYSRPSAPKQRQLSRVHDIIFWYSKNDLWTFNPDEIRQEYSPLSKSRDGYSGGASKMTAGGNVELNKKGKFPEDWIYIPPLKGNSHEFLGYPTQKPVALLKRILKASANKDDVVLDPFCGCGTTIAAAQDLNLKENYNLKWIGIDITHLSIALQKYRLKDSFKLNEKKDYKVIGEPEDLSSARQLSLEDRYQFQWWALSLIKARPLGASSGSKTGKKGSDKGIDGVIVFVDDNSGKAKRVLVQVKSGKVKSGDIRDLVGTITREDAAIGVFITLENATRDMITEAVSAGFYHSNGWNRDYPKMQIFTIEDLLKGKELQIPGDLRTFKQAEKVNTNLSAPQNAFDFE